MKKSVGDIHKYIFISCDNLLNHVKRFFIKNII